LTDKYCGITNRRIISLYETLHGADIQKSYEVMDAHFASGESRLKAVRKKCGLTQEALAKCPVEMIGLLLLEMSGMLFLRTAAMWSFKRKLHPMKGGSIWTKYPR
jgi:hypothetical protein